MVYKHLYTTVIIFLLDCDYNIIINLEFRIVFNNFLFQKLPVWALNRKFGSPNAHAQVLIKSYASPTVCNPESIAPEAVDVLKPKCSN